MSHNDGFHIFDSDEPVATPSNEVLEGNNKNLHQDSQIDPDNHCERYLVFCCGNIEFATPLLSAREVIESIPFQEVPHTKDYFLGIANFRGEVIGLVDFSAMVGLESSLSKNPVAILFETQHGSLGIYVDQIKGVQEISNKDIETQAHIKSHVPQEYLHGIAKASQGLIAIIDLKKILDEDDMLLIRKTQNI